MFSSALAALLISTAAAGTLGSVQIQGIDAYNGRVWLDGRVVSFDQGTASFVAAGVLAGQHEIRVENANQVMLQGAFTVQPDQNYSCALGWNGAFACQYTQPAFGAYAPPPTPAPAAPQPTMGTVYHGSTGYQGTQSSVTVSYSGNIPAAPQMAAPQMAAPPPPPEPAAPTAMASSDFSSLVNTVRGRSFGDDKLSVIRTSAAHNHFSVNQVGQLVDQFSFGDDKVNAVQILAPKVIDPQNAFQLGNKFSFSDDRDQALGYFQ
ncbi:MAG: DUF4476 domain-containing protein [Proteobacteria bacterium]|jgi:hypothetical protein|nr:DUF4476 domain-containing protein [Pseudomonadota bacterium]